MLANLIMTVTNKSPKARGIVFKWTFETLAALTRDVDSWTMMNYGFAGTDGNASPLRLAPNDEAERYCIQLYHHAAAPVELRDKDVVEISCGRGGGAAYVKRYLGARSVTGVDLSVNQIKFCRRVHEARGLRFVQGAAEDIPLPDECADALINIEASCLYQDKEAFFHEVFRLLRPGGYFIYADIHRCEEVDALFAQLGRSGLTIEACRDITANVLRALALDSDRRLAGVRRLAPFFLRSLLKTFAGTQETRIPEGLADGSFAYLSFVLTKPGVVSTHPRNRARDDAERVPAFA